MPSPNCDSYIRLGGHRGRGSGKDVRAKDGEVCSKKKVSSAMTLRLFQHQLLKERCYFRQQHAKKLTLLQCVTSCPCLGKRLLLNSGSPEGDVVRGGPVDGKRGGAGNGMQMTKIYDTNV